MAVAYTSNRFPVGFKPHDMAGIQNGSLALANTSYTIADNQHWLVLGDMPLVNFHQGAISGNTTRKITILVPPFFQYAGFHFLCGRDMDGSTPDLTNVGIGLSCATSDRYIRHIPFGEDLANTGKGLLSFYAQGWVHADMISLNPQTDDGGALQLNSAPSETWTTVDVTITIDTNVVVSSAAYHLIPTFNGYEVQA